MSVLDKLAHMKAIAEGGIDMPGNVQLQLIAAVEALRAELIQARMDEWAAGVVQCSEDHVITRRFLEAQDVDKIITDAAPMLGEAKQ